MLVSFTESDASFWVSACSQASLVPHPDTGRDELSCVGGPLTSSQNTPRALGVGRRSGGEQAERDEQRGPSCESHYRLPSSWNSALLELGADALPDDELLAARGPLNPPPPDSTLLVHTDGVVAPTLERDLNKLRLCHDSCPPRVPAHARFTLTFSCAPQDRSSVTAGSPTRWTR